MQMYSIARKWYGSLQVDADGLGFHSVTGQKRALLAQQTPRTLLSGGRLKDLLPHARSTRPTVSFLGICLTPGESPLAPRCRDLYAPSTMTHRPFPYRTPCPPPLPQRTGGPSERERGRHRQTHCFWPHRVFHGTPCGHGIGARSTNGSAQSCSLQSKRILASSSSSSSSDRIVYGDFDVVVTVYAPSPHIARGRISAILEFFILRQNPTTDVKQLALRVAVAGCTRTSGCIR